MDIKNKTKEIEKLSRVQKIYEHPLFRECLEKNRRAEETRRFCKHDMAHFLDVARLAYILSMERGWEVPKEQIYAAALLHDIGKWQQYEAGVPHEEAGAFLAEEILGDTGFSGAEREQILSAIRRHRKRDGAEAEPLAALLYDADKLSRACYACPAEPECNWSREKKNLGIGW